MYDEVEAQAVAAEAAVVRTVQRLLGNVASDKVLTHVGLDTEGVAQLAETLALATGAVVTSVDAYNHCTTLDAACAYARRLVESHAALDDTVSFPSPAV